MTDITNLPAAFRAAVDALIYARYIHGKDNRLPCLTTGAPCDEEVDLWNATSDLEDVLADIILLFTQNDSAYQFLLTVETPDDEVSQ